MIRRHRQAGVTGLSRRNKGPIRYLSIFPDPGFKRPHSDGAIGFGVKIAVIDSGVNPPLRRWVRDLIDLTGGTGDDDLGHGTTVGGLIKRYAPGCEVLVAKVGSRAHGISSARVIEALQWAYDKGAQIVNLSIGHPLTRSCLDRTCAVCRTVDALAREGIAVVVAAGNKDGSLHTMGCPACADGSLTVGAVNTYGQVAEYMVDSIPERAHKPEILAPGTVRFQTGQSDWTGTSFAAPVVSAAVALLAPRVGLSRAVEILKETADRIPNEGHATGHGVINMRRAWEVASGAGAAGSTGESSSS